MTARAGASVGALCAILFGFASVGIHGAAFVGALAAMFVVFGLAHGDGSWTQTRLLLTGVIVAAGCGALVALLLWVNLSSQVILFACSLIIVGAAEAHDRVRERFGAATLAQLRRRRAEDRVAAAKRALREAQRDEKRDEGRAFE